MHNIPRNSPCPCGSEKKYKHCHLPIDERLCAQRAAGLDTPPRALLKTAPQLDKIRESGRVNTAVLDCVARHITAGMTTGDIDRLVERETRRLGGIPAPLGYGGYPKSVCVSVNDVVCHGIPGSRVLVSGDIVNVDVSTVLDGYFSDASRMFCIGDVSEENRRLVDSAHACVLAGLSAVRPWGFLGDIGAAVSRRAAVDGFSVVREIGGHGIGLAFHEDPWVGYTTKAGTGMVLAPGLCFTIEPMLNRGAPDVYTASDGWTVRTRDGLPSAQWEIQVIITEDGYLVLSA